MHEVRPEVSTDQAARILRAAFGAGIGRVHWTGGEPTLRPDFVDLVAEATTIGYREQIVTTNGVNSSVALERAGSMGLHRANVSVDTLDESRFEALTSKHGIHKVLRTVDLCLTELPGMVKFNVCVMRSSLPELSSLRRYVALKAAEHGNTRIALKLISLTPNNPAFGSRGGVQFFHSEQVSESELISALQLFGDLEALPFGTVHGDNPNCRYYWHVRRCNKVLVGVLAMPSWGYPCGGEKCRKLRVTPFGLVTNCLSGSLVDLSSAGPSEASEVIRALIDERRELDRQDPDRTHYRECIGEMRFGKTSAPVPRAAFTPCAGHGDGRTRDQCLPDIFGCQGAS